MSRGIIHSAVATARARVRKSVVAVQEQLAKGAYTTSFQGLPVHIEHDRGDVRRGTDPDGHDWATRMPHPYGSVDFTRGADGEELDIMIGPNRLAPMAYVIQTKYPGSQSFDEIKILAGFDTRADAERAFRSAYDKPGFLLDVTTWPMPALIEVVRRHPELQHGRLDAAALARVLRMAKGKTNVLRGGRGDDLDPEDVDPDELARGESHEREHTDDPRVAREIALDHLAEDPAYYSNLRAMEARAKKRLAKARELFKARRNEHNKLPGDVLKTFQRAGKTLAYWGPPDEPRTRREPRQAKHQRHPDGLDLSAFARIDYGYRDQRAVEKHLAAKVLGPGRTFKELASYAVALTGVDQADIVGAVGRVSVNGWGRLEVSFTSATGFKLGRVYDFEERVASHNAFYIEGRGRTGQGLATRMLARAIDRLRAGGFRRIRTDAAGRPDAPMNGYYTWPRLGFDAKLSELEINQFRELGHRALHLSDLMATSSGRAAWKAHGEACFVTFDLAPGSVSSRVFAAYLEEKGIALTKAAHESRQPERDVEHPPELTAEDDAILGRIWDRIGRERKLAKAARARVAAARALVKAHVTAHTRKLKNGRVVQVGAHERRDEHPHDVLRRAVVRAVVKHGRPVALAELPAKLPRRHRETDPKVLESVVGDLLSFGLLSPHEAGIIAGGVAAPGQATATPTAVLASPEGVAFQLMHAWRDYPEARAALERVMLAVGMTRVHAAGDVVPFDGIRHAGDAGWPEDPVVVTHPGWALPTADGFDRILERAQVRALEKAFQHRARKPKDPTGWEPPGGTHPKTWRRGSAERKTPPTSSPAEFKRAMARELVSAWNHVEHVEAREQLERAMVSLGLKRHHTRGERVAFDGRYHVGDGLWAGDAAEVEHPGWSVADENGHHRIQKVKVRAPIAAQRETFGEDFERVFDRLSRNRTFGVVELWALREALPAYPRAAFDQELAKLRQAGRFELWTADGRHHAITPQEHDAAIEERGQQYYYVVRRGGD